MRARRVITLLKSRTVRESTSMVCLFVSCQLSNYYCMLFQGVPFIRPMPKVTAVAGRALEVKCPVAGYPIEAITWEKGARDE